MKYSKNIKFWNNAFKILYKTECYMLFQNLIIAMLLNHDVDTKNSASCLSFFSRNCFQFRWTHYFIWKTWYKSFLILQERTPVYLLESICGETLITPSGTIQSPNFPSNYPNDVFCKWQINVPGKARWKVQIERLNLEDDNICAYDFLAVYDGLQADSAKEIGR